MQSDSTYRSSPSAPATAPKTPLERIAISVLLFCYASGVLAHLLPTVLPLTRYITDLFLFGINGLVLYAIYQRNRDVRLFYWLIAAYVFTFATEALGVATGLIFGEYTYGATMWMQWLGVPFAIALNWCVLALAANDLSSRLIHSPWVAAGLAGTMLALYDVVIEPVAIALDYWTWAAVTVPIRNYLAWAVVGILISLPLQLFSIRYRSPLWVVYFVAQLVFFLLLNLLL